MDVIVDNLIVPLLVLLGLGLCAAILAGKLYLIHFLLTLPMRRAERARLFLDLIETALDRGQPVEEALISASHSRDRLLGVRFHLLASWLQRGLRLSDAIAQVPRLLPPQITAILKAGQRIGDLRKVLPACRQLLGDSLSETRSAVNYLVVLAFVVTPLSLVVFAMICVKILPAMQQVAEGMAVPQAFALPFVWQYARLILLAQAVAILVLWFVAFIYASGPRALSWLPLLHEVFFCLPWRRKRMNRDFSALLAVLLDARVPEAEAVGLAADCTANRVFQRRAMAVAGRLKQGMKLTEAIQTMDDAGEFRWRLTNAAHATDGFRAALAGWHEALDARAFQQEQAAAHGVTTALLLLNGLFVGTVVVSVFSFLVSIINAGLLW